MDKTIRIKNIPEIINILKSHNKDSIANLMNEHDFSQLTKDNIELSKIINELVSDYRTEILNIISSELLETDTNKRLRNILSDLINLPLEKGDACPSHAQISELQETIQESHETFKDIIDVIYENLKKNGAISASGFYNNFSTYDEENAQVIRNKILQDNQLMSQIKTIQNILINYIDGGTKETAQEAIFDLLSGKPNKNVDSKTEALILIQELKNTLTEFFIEKIKDSIKKDGLPLIDNGNSIENHENFISSIKVASNFENLDRKAYLDMLQNDLGQAQTANAGKAESFFRNRESVQNKQIQNNFGYVYLNKEQADNLDLKIGINTSFEFTYFDKTYLAIPVGLYFSKKDPKKYLDTMEELENLVNDKKNTPAETYYKSLIRYYEFHNRQPNLKDNDFIEGYYNACYEAEQAWVEYIRYANEKKLPYIHIHPFENYGMTSTKTHDLSLAFVNHEETSIYSEAGAKFVKNAELFFKNSGLTNEYPEMIQTTLDAIKSVCFLSLSARVNAGLKGTIAQNIPNEKAGRKKGMVTLFDTDYAKSALRSGYTNLVKKLDPIGTISAQYEKDINNDELFMIHYIIEILSHELNHNSFKGKEQSFNGDGKGLPIKSIEEAKATNGLALNFKNPYKLDKEEMIKLKKVIHLMIPWSIFRMRSPYRAQHSSNQYFKEGAVLLDHLLKSGVLEIVGVKLDKDGNHKYLEGSNFDLGDFEFIRINKSDKTLQDFISRCASFTRDIGEIYNQSQGFSGELEKDTVINDVIKSDFYQIVNKICYEEEIAKKNKNGENTTSQEEAMNKLFDPRDEILTKQAKAIIRLVDNKEQQLLEDAVQKTYTLNDDNAIHTKNMIQEIKETIEKKYPSIYEQ